MAYDEKTAERVRHFLADQPGFHEKKMFGGIAFMVKGGMCCAVSRRGGILVRVGPEAVRLAKREPHVRPMIMGGRPAKAFVRVMPDGYRTTAQLRKWVKRALDFLATLPAKPARRRGGKTE